jgi:hypothetical protein
MENIKIIEFSILKRAEKHHNAPRRQGRVQTIIKTKIMTRLRVTGAYLVWVY